MSPVRLIEFLPSCGVGARTGCARHRRACRGLLGGHGREHLALQEPSEQHDNHRTRSRCLGYWACAGKFGPALCRADRDMMCESLGVEAPRPSVLDLPRCRHRRRNIRVAATRTPPRLGPGWPLRAGSAPPREVVNDTVGDSDQPAERFIGERTGSCRYLDDIAVLNSDLQRRGWILGLSK